MPVHEINPGQNLDAITNDLNTILNAQGVAQPAKIIFVCGDAHAPGGGAGAGLDLCNGLAGKILDGYLTPYCSAGLTRSQLSLHVETANTDAAINMTQQQLQAVVPNLTELNLARNSDVFGWEPVGYACFDRLSELMQLPVMNHIDIGRAGNLINQSNQYFQDIHQPWTQNVRNSLQALGMTLNQGMHARTLAVVNYTNSLLASRVNANMALAQSINQSITNVDNKFVHFVSIGNDHIVLGNNVINGINLGANNNCLCFSIPR
ncbi:hypothetical protein [Pseudoalteromonas luteoviolacea]|uniref:Uncharacterized protein n=1 Tax=Pseudoalteromonas luteoviolacea NCIMB 1942 TaxID=1365253 RepID=A0A167BCT3_9GAMM|nr:hypothetical protein [Pseudoalteromonas luteoviolacea]KZN46385.1 hypothetical protein N482_12845 [Pseudoalteromonas luteoviolacea NCIMB 1942]